jgi:uncharacterized cysteine cluster protein YcgN (CxxCxxCC family)
MLSFIVDEVGVVYSCNNNAEKFLNKKLEQIVGKNLNSLCDVCGCCYQENTIIYSRF